MVRVGVLDCDLYKDFPPAVGFQYYGDRVQSWLGDPADDWTWTQFRVAEASELPTPAQIEADFDGFVIPGSRFNTTDDEPWIEPLCETIRAAHASGKALFGICFGHQAIARALGGVAGAAPPYNFTVDEIELDAPASKLLGGRSSLRLYKSHGQQVLQAPPGAAVIARSARTPVEMYTVGGNVFCCQGHPEFTKTAMDAILDTMIERNTLDESEVATAAAVLGERDVEADPVRSLVRRLLAGERTPSLLQQQPPQHAAL